MIQKNDVYRVNITDINNLGYGVGRIDGEAVFVAGAVSGDVLDVKIIKANKNYCVGRIENVIEASRYRIENKCRVSTRCGGCVYNHITYEHELELKRNYVKYAFAKAGVGNIQIAPVRSTGEINHYRNKAQYPVGEKSANGKIISGFYAAKTHDIVEMENCALQPEFFGEVTGEIKKFMEKYGIPAYDEISCRGCVRHIYLRYGKNTGELMVCLVINGKKLAHSAEFVGEMTAKFPQIKSIVLNVNDKNTNVVLGKENICIYGNDYITDKLCGYTFKISASSFYQVNHDAAEMLYGIAKEKANIKETDTVMDLYCGIGTIGICTAAKAKKLIGIEIIDEAVACAKENAELNGVKNAEFYCSDAANPFDCTKENPDVVIVDPPRKGCAKELIEQIAERKIKKVLYISCGPDTLSRDVALFYGYGYCADEVVPVDMFPRTGHVETVVLLSRT